MSTYVVRPAKVEDAAAMAYVQVRSWRETYRGVVPDERLDRPDFEAERRSWWAQVISDWAGHTITVMVAEREGKVVGIASAGAPLDDDAQWSRQLYVLYVLADFHGSGMGADLLTAVIGEADAGLWVADPNPRAQAFYRKHGFQADGIVNYDEGIREIRMVRHR